MDENQSKNTLFAEFLTKAILLPQRIVRFLIKKSNITIDLIGPMMKLDPKEMEILWKDFANASYTKKPSLILRTLFPSEEKLYFEWESMGLSRIHWKRKWNSDKIYKSILQRLLEPYFDWEKNWMRVYLEEFTYFAEGKERWNLYLSFRETKKSPLPAEHYKLSKTYIMNFFIPYSDAARFVMENVQPASFQKTSVLITVIQSFVKQISYPLWTEEFDSNQNIWLRDYFMNVRANDGSNPDTQYSQYIGSNYSNEILTKGCLHLKFKRKFIPWNLRIKIQNDECAIFWNEKTISRMPRTKHTIHLTDDSRIHGAKLLETYQSGTGASQTICTVWKGGIYDLDIHRMDLPPIR